MSVPKYAKLENERRFLVAAGALPDLSGLAFRRIEDRYVVGTRMRLRAATHGETGARELKFCKKYEGADPVSGPIVNIYLTEAEHAVLATLPARVLHKRRYPVEHDGRGFGLDVFEGELDGLILCEAEAEAESPEAILAVSFPHWAIREVTRDPFFTGGHLSGLVAEDLWARLGPKA